MKTKNFLNVLLLVVIIMSIIACNKKITPTMTKKSHCDQLWDELQKPQEINGVTFVTETKVPTVYDIDTLIKYQELDATGFGIQNSLSLAGFEGNENSYLKDGIRYVERDNAFKDATICPAEVAKKIHHQDMGNYRALVIQWILRPSGETIDFAIIPIQGNYYQLYGYYKGGFKAGANNNLIVLSESEQVPIVIFAKVGEKTQKTQEEATTPPIPSKGSSKWGSNPPSPLPANTGNSQGSRKAP